MFKIKITIEKKTKISEIIIGDNLFFKLKEHLKKIEFSKIVIITDTIVDSFYGKKIKKALESYKLTTIVIPAGEKFKTLYTASAVYDQMIKASLNRDTLVIAFGGGVIGDLAGFVASTYMRGLPVIQVPTTLLAQVDASIGGKTGVDHTGGKNLIGAFYQPKLVLIDVDFLKTLPIREIKTGLAEVVKYGIIKDSELFAKLELNPKSTSKFWTEVICCCAAIKAEVVAKDEKEVTGLRMILNFGHTFGHAIESLTGYSKYTHGEGVAIGMVAAANLAFKLKMLKEKDLLRIVSLIAVLGLPTKCDLAVSTILKALYMDKKAKSGKIRFVLPVKIGKVVVRDDISEKTIKLSLKEIGCV